MRCDVACVMCLVVFACSCQGSPFASAPTPETPPAVLPGLPNSAATAERALSQEELREKWRMPFRVSTALASAYLEAAEAPAELLLPQPVDTGDTSGAPMPLALLLQAIEEQLEPWVPSQDQEALKVVLQQQIDEGKATIGQWNRHLALEDMPPLMESLSAAAWETAMSVMQAMIEDGLTEEAIQEMAQEGMDWLTSLEGTE